MPPSPTPVIQIQGVGKRYRLGTINRQQLADDLKAWVAKLRGKADPTVPIGTEVDPQRIGEDFWALRHVSFEVNEGEVLGIIGHNGAGKSTLLKLLSRITLPTEGTISMRGKVSSLLEVGTGFHPELTGRENVYLNGAILGMRRQEVDAKIGEIIAFSGIKHHIDTPVKRYSSGMRVRLGFAVAAHLDPEILIIDEVLSVGDAEFQRKSMGKMKESAQSGRTVLFVSHNMTAVRSLCTRVVWMDHGRVRMQGPTEEVLNAYLSKHSADRTEVTWDDPATAPGNNLARLRHVRVSSASGDGLFHWENPINVEVALENLRADGHDLSLNIQVITGDNLVVFAHNSMEGCPGLVIERGLHRFRIQLPARTFNAGMFQLTTRVAYRSRGIFRAENVVGFEMQDPPRAGAWHGKRQGFFRLQLPWEHQYHDLAE